MAKKKMVKKVQNQQIYKNGEDGSNDEQALMDWMYGPKKDYEKNDEIVEDDYVGEYWSL